MLKTLQGKKTYITVIAGLLATVAWMMKFIDYETFQGLMAVLGFTSIATLRQGVTAENAATRKIVL